MKSDGHTADGCVLKAKASDLVAFLHLGKSLLCAVQELHPCPGSIHLRGHSGAELCFVGLVLLSVLLQHVWEALQVFWMLQEALHILHCCFASIHSLDGGHRYIVRVALYMLQHAIILLILL